MKPRSQSHLQPWNHFNKFRNRVLLGAFLLLVVSMEVTVSRFLVKSLPGLLGDLPFTLETGYIGVGKSDEVQLFYYFFESEGNPKADPLMIWLTGGPGCSALSGLLYEIGPFMIDYANSTLEKPMLQINPHSWTKVANIIFLDQPAGSGFSYAKTPEAYITNDTLSTMQVYHFLRKWLLEHPKFLNNPLYLGSDSYGGIVVPMIVQEIYNGNEVGEGLHINIKGYVLGNPSTDASLDYNSKIPFAHRMGFLSDAIYKEDNYLYSYTWANRKDVREALDIHEEYKEIEWVRCNETLRSPNDHKKVLSYTHTVPSTVAYHRHLADRNCQALVYRA